MLAVADVLDSLVRSGVLASLCLVLGGVAWALWVLRVPWERPPSRATRRCLTLLGTGGVALAVGQALLLALKARVLTESLGRNALGDFAATTYFHAAATRVLLALAVAGAAVWLTRRPGAHWAWALLAGALRTKTASRWATRRSSSSSGTRTCRRPRSWTCGRTFRVLENVLERAIITSPGPTLRLAGPLGAESGRPCACGALRSLREVERDHILRVLDTTGWTIEGARGAAAILDLKASTLRSRMRKLGIERRSRWEPGPGLRDLRPARESRVAGNGADVPLMPSAIRAGIRATNAAGSVLLRMGLRPVSLDERDLLGAARRATGLDDFGEDDFRAPLGWLLQALESEAELTLLGRVAARRDLGGLLANRLRLQADRRRFPDIAAERVAAPIFITGLPRSGSTFLHHLLGQDPQTRVPQAWEVMYPSPPPARTTYATDRRIGQASKQLRWIDWLAPDFKAMHPVGAQLPLECIAIMSASFRSTRFQTTYHVPGYEAWLEAQDMRPAYAFHKRVLQHLQWQAPGERWVLKAPAHLFAFDALLATYPDARIVQTHRDPVTVVASLASMSAVLQAAFTDRVDSRDVGREVIQRWMRGLERAVELRRSGQVARERAVDVHYAELTRDPMAVMRRIYARFDMPLSEVAETRMRQFLTDHPKGKHGPHRYALERYGFDAEELASRYKGYCEYFGVPSEAPALE